jgi:hypothetical protein
MTDKIKRVNFTIIKKDNSEATFERELTKVKPVILPKVSQVKENQGSSSPKRSQPIPIPKPKVVGLRAKVRNHKKISSIPNDVKKFSSGFSLF